MRVAVCSSMRVQSGGRLKEREREYAKRDWESVSLKCERKQVE